MSNPFDSTTLDTGNELISKMAAENKRRWEEMITSTDLTGNSPRAWHTIRNISDSTIPKPVCLVTANQVAHQLLVNGRGEMPTKHKCPKLSQISEDYSSLVFPFTEEEYKKGIATPQNNKAAGIDDVLVKLKKGPTEGACSMAVPAMSTRHMTRALRMPSTPTAIRNAKHR